MKRVGYGIGFAVGLTAGLAIGAVAYTIDRFFGPSWAGMAR